ncbi:MAG: leucine-rich repeat domain-containing protein, partial [Treponemataceae bacterium]|nr:leucine-rich repeat domain-containing protein [Treponemataceae bacterium]
IPNSVTVIGENPFKDCSALAEVTCAKNISGWSKLIVRRGSKEGFTAVQCADGAWRASDMDDWQAEKLNGKYTLVRYLGSGADVTVPAWISVIGEGAFKDKDKIKTIKILKSATGDSQYISANAFEGCASLARMEMPDVMGRIDTDAFKGCADVDISFAGTIEAWTKVAKNANIADCVMVRCADGYWHNPRYWKIDEINLALNDYTGTAKTVRLPEHVVFISPSAFTECENLECVQIPAGLEVTIFGGALSRCETITWVEILDGVTSIGDEVFSNCKSLASVTIPDSVTSIGAGAFYGCGSLTSVTIPDSVKSIGDEAFYDCDSLESVTISSSVERIGNKAFWNCYNLKDVTYLGKQAQWNALIGASTDFSKATIHCTDGDITPKN